MARILIKPRKTAFVEEMNRTVTVSRQRTYFVSDIDKDFHCQDGVIKKEDLNSVNGDSIKSSKGDVFQIFDASYYDIFNRIKRLPQIIPLKDLGWVLSTTGIGNESKILDAGTGSGAICCFFARHCKEVFSYDIRDDHIEIANENKDFLNCFNLTIQKKDVTKGFDQKNADLVMLDLPAPWEALSAANEALKPGGFIVSYSPMITQVQDLTKKVKELGSLIILKTVELTEREWEVDDRKVRPKSRSSIHSGFLTLIRKISK